MYQPAADSTPVRKPFTWHERLESSEAVCTPAVSMVARQR
jgi:hypothetical protein